MEPCSTSIPIIEGVSLAVGGDVGAPARSMATSDRSMAASVAADEREELLISAGLAIDTKVNDPEDEQGHVRKRVWYRHRRVVVAVVLNALSLLALAAGGVLASQVSPERKATFRWLIFAGALFPLFYLTKLATKCIYHFVEIYYFQEALYHFHSLKTSTHHLLFFTFLLLSYYMIFEWLWCSGMFEGVCTDAAYIQVTRTMLKIIACATLACLATFMAALVAKLVSTHFLKSTHFQKLHLALQKEYILKRLSNPKLRRKPAAPADATRTSSQFSKRSSTLTRLSRAATALTSSSRSDHPRDGSHSRTVSADDVFEWEAKSASAMFNIKHRQPALPSRYLKLGKSISFDDLHIQDKTQPGDHDPAAAPSIQRRSADVPDAVHDTPDTPRDSSGATTPNSMSRENSIFAPRVSTGAGIEMEMDRTLLEGVRLQLLELEDRKLKEMTEQELDKLRTAVVVKTSSAMLRQHKFRTPEEQAEQVEQVTAFARALFFTIRGRTRAALGNVSRAEANPTSINLKDVRLFYPDTAEGKRDAKRAFSLFSNNPQASVTMQQVVDAVLEIYTARGNIAKSLSNTESMIGSLQSCLAAGLHFLFFALYMVIWQIDVLAGFSAFSATVLGLSFIFGNSIRNLFESMLFLFVEHPYDIGDWVEIDGALYEVIKITLMHTHFEANGRVPALFPNFSLLPKQIRNMTRRPEHLELLFVEVDFGMAEAVKAEIKSSLTEMAKSHPNDYNPLPLWVVYVGVSPNLKARLLVIWTYACAPADWNRKLPLRDRAIQIVTDVFAKHKDSGATYTFTHNTASTGSAALSAALATSMSDLPPDAMAALQALNSGLRTAN
eukprot:jgi/Tetstr1/444925/TSEL_032743.t1